MLSFKAAFMVRVWRFKALRAVSRNELAKCRENLLRIQKLRPLICTESLLIAYTFYAQDNHVQCAQYLRRASEALHRAKRLGYDDKQHLLLYMHRMLRALRANEGVTNIPLSAVQRYNPEKVKSFIRHTFVVPPTVI
ncbi:hypothetical protein [Kordiimonas sp.]|uniref:hypothetical protein n=1 Tax=Kordiimonas sp. TaxID=1970157 RepID=UPI003A938450